MGLNINISPFLLYAAAIKTEAPLDTTILLYYEYKVYITILWLNQGFPGGSVGKEPTCNAGDPGSIPGWGRSPGEGNGNPLQYSCLENPMNRGAW